MKAIEQYFPVVLFIVLYNAVLTFESLNEILKCEHSNESYYASIACGPFYFAAQVVLAFESVDEIITCDQLTIQMKAIEQLIFQRPVYLVLYIAILSVVTQRY